jgi:oligoribonuclease
MKKLLWIDLEMTGLNVDSERIIELAAMITDLDFKELANYHAVIKQEPSFLDSMDDWNKKTHSESGLIDLIPSGKAQKTVENEVLHMISEYFGKEDVVIAGNSISQDRLFIDRYMPELGNRLHYRMLDVSSFKLIFKHKFSKEFQKKNNHRAIDDIKESIEELKFYLQFISFST